MNTDDHIVGPPANQWELIEYGYLYRTIQADSAADALAEAVSNVVRHNYSPINSTVYVDVIVRNTATGEEDRETVTLEPDEPECSEPNHDWQSPYDLLGGCAENPGVWGHGGGVIMREVCAHCGVYRITDTWAQRRDTGEQGLVETTYEPADEKSLEWVASLSESH